MSQYLVSARKYRPVRFDEVVGQGHVTQTLKNALKQDKLAHAFLFCGPRGVGKTTCARILARVLNCENVTQDHEPCNSCNSCQSFNNNASFNILELDAASNNSVDHIRALVEQVRFQPQQGKYKIFIIDEVHMLSTQAFNAFLKTLEEPPPYAIFILATTEKHKIIPTILSRCQIYDFKRIAIADTVKHLQGICDQEDIKAEEDALHIIAEKADGALRDALSIFDRMASSSVGEVTYEGVIRNLNVLDFQYYFRAVDALIAGDHAQAMLILEEVFQNGFEGDTFINGLAEHIRNLLVIQDTRTTALLETSATWHQRYQEQAMLASSSFLLTALNIANQTDVQFPLARNKRLHTEMSLIRMAHIHHVMEVGHAALAAEKKKPKSELIEGSPSRSTPPAEDIQPVPPEEEQMVVNTFQPQLEHSAQTKAATSEVVEAEPVSDATPDSPAAIPHAVDKTVPPSKAKPSPVGGSLKSLSSLEKAFILKQQEQEEVELDLDQIRAVWEEYAEKADSPSLRQFLLDAQIKLQGERITVVVGTQMARGMIQQDTDLMPFIREQVRYPNLGMLLEVDTSLAPERDTSDDTPTTPREIFDHLGEKNPMLYELRKRFDLRIDPV
ncbi:MAG: DNA polymerase III subunit gamma/tau [Saprospiraceae bacterium]|nr:DNA polymerase III subunit gamma/tau [Saprospiraceae bacterium]